MTRRIFRAIMAVSAAVLLANIIIVMGCLYQYYREKQAAELMDELYLAAQGVERGGRGYLEGIDSDSYRLTWVAPDGTVLFDTAEDYHKLGSHGDREEIREALQKGEGGSSRFSGTMTEETFYRARRLTDGSVLRISVSRASLFTLVMAMLQPICIVGILAAVLSAVLAQRLSRRIVRPLNRLDLERPLEDPPYEELEPLLRKIQDQRVQLSEQMKSAKRRSDEFTSNVSHELKTPLQVISGSAEMLEDGTVKPGDAPEFIHLIRTEAARMMSLVEDIIHLSRLDEGAAVDFERTDLYAAAQSVACALEGRAGEKGVSLTLHGERAEIMGAPGLLYELIYNLCDNAIKYNVDGGRVEVEVTPRPGGAKLTVSDTGTGIPPEYQARVFERFFRVDKSRSKASGGTGLGLSIVKHIAMLHGASVTLSSKVGEGTVISVMF